MPATFTPDQVQQMQAPSGGFAPPDGIPGGVAQASIPDQPYVPVNIVRIVSQEESRVLKFKFAGQVFTLNPGSEILAPSDAAILWFGDGKLQNTERQRFRTDEFARLRAKYGAYDDAELWEKNRPKVEIHGMDGERIFYILDDPDGENVTEATTTVAQQQQILDQINKLVEQNNRLQSEVAELKNQPAPEPSPEVGIGEVSYGESSEAEVKFDTAVGKFVSDVEVSEGNGVDDEFEVEEDLPNQPGVEGNVE